VNYSNEELAKLPESGEHVESIIDVNADMFVAPGTPANKMTDRIKAFCSRHGLAIPTTHGEIISTVLRD
jgi:hypothetical protein